MLERSLSSKIGLLHRVSYFLPVSKLQLIYNAIIQYRLDYGIKLWGSCCKTYLCTLQRKQNRCARIVSKNSLTFSGIEQNSVLSQRSEFQSI